MKCWICGGAAESGEHRAKKSDLAMVFRGVTQQTPIYEKSVPSGQNPKIQKIGSLKSDKLKWDSKLCHECNTTRSQPFDYAWAILSAYLQSNQNRLKNSKKLKLQSVFPGSVTKSMLNVHLYFIKMFGCILTEHNVPIPIQGFSESILNGSSHPNVYLGIGYRGEFTKKNVVLVTPIESLTEENSSVIHFASWQYWIRNVFIDVIYSINPDYLMVVNEFWHPDKTQKIMRLSEIKVNQQGLRQFKEKIDNAT